MSDFEIGSEKAPNIGTGEMTGKGSLGQTILYPFGPYEVLIRISNTGEFVEIVEIQLNKDFRDFQQKIESRGYHDVNDIYESK